jgi:hypothetical protein
MQGFVTYEGCKYGENLILAKVFLFLFLCGCSHTHSSTYTSIAAKAGYKDKVCAI